MGEPRSSLQTDLMDLLINGPSSFAALYGGLVNNLGYPTQLSVPLVMDVLDRMEQEGLVKSWKMAVDGSFNEPTSEERAKALSSYRLWLPDARFEDLSVDEVGLWYELSSKARDEWRALVGDHVERPSQWMIDDDSHTRTITICASTVQTAETALRIWLSHNPGIAVLGDSKAVESISGFVLRDGSVVKNGVKVVWPYRSRES